MDGCGWLLLPFHGGNRGSNPLGDANKFNKITHDACILPKYFPKTYSWTVPDRARAIFWRSVPAATDPISGQAGAARLQSRAERRGSHYAREAA
jgi:hypothetical protein